MQTIHIVERTLPMAWEKAVVSCWEQGDRIPTQYDKPGDPASRDVIVMVHITEPLAEPRIHRAFPGGLADLEKYRAEVLYGVHDHWIKPEEGKWEYTYHDRMFNYRVPGLSQPIDQIEQCIQMLRDCPHTRRAQAVTWKAWEDISVHDPACLQRMFFRVHDGRLNLNVHMRSNDAFKAAFMNMYAFIDLQAWVAARVGMPVGRYVHIADSFHIYGSYFHEFEGFLKLIGSRSPEQRVWSTDGAVPMFIEGCDALLAEDDMPVEKKALVRQRKAELEEMLAAV
ncbi:MAG TPA: thymidylate synthase [Phycisphaerae bacterium]|nr:thymidylate synthase [Phycisphaerae bacterium]